MALLRNRKEIKWIARMGEGASNPNFNGGKYMDDKGYLRILRPEHPFANAGYIYEHRLVMEAHLGRHLQSWETIHHINEVKLDNRVANLFLTTVPEHSAIHREGKKKTKEVRNNLRKGAKARSKVAKRGKDGTYLKKE